MKSDHQSSSQVLNSLSQPLVLCYHAVSETWPEQLGVSPVLIERQLNSLLDRGFRAATAEEAVFGRGKILHVTFDDAYRSVFKVLPVLEKMRIQATVFACAAYADDGRPLNVPEVRRLAETFPQEMATMNWDELRFCAERGIEIGSHTLTHPHLTAVTDRDLQRELVASRTRFQEELGRPCRFLAYPYGEHDKRVRLAARRAGYEAAFCVKSNERYLSNRYAVPRVDLYRKDNLLRTTLKTSGSYHAIKYLIDRFNLGLTRAPQED